MTNNQSNSIDTIGNILLNFSNRRFQKELCWIAPDNQVKNGNKSMG